MEGAAKEMRERLWEGFVAMVGGSSVAFAASFNHVCAGLLALTMVAYYIRKDSREERRGRTDSGNPFPRGKNDS